MMKSKSMVLLVITFVMIFSFSAFAGSWQKDAIGWWYQNDDGSYLVNQWFLNPTDGRWYYFDGRGYMMSDNTTPDGYWVGSDGAWVQGGASSSSTTGGNISGSNTTKQPETVWLTNLDYLSKDRVYVKDNGKDNFGTSYRNHITSKHVYGNQSPNIVYYLNNDYSRLTGTFALDYEYRSEADERVIMTIYADDTEIYSTSPVLKNGEPEEIDVDIEGCEKLKIEFSIDASCHRYFFGNAKLIK